jgi:ribosomal protein S18 acetylase RimI-like enzyme
MQLKLAEINDLGIIDEIYKNAIENMIKHNIFQWDEFYPSKNILRDDIVKKQLYKIIIEENIISAFVLNKEYDKEYLGGKWKYNGNNFIVLHRLCINTKYQNKGIGTKIMLYIENYLKIRGVKSIRLDAFSKNPIALKLYNNLGYKKTGEVNWRKGLFVLFEKIIND